MHPEELPEVVKTGLGIFAAVREHGGREFASLGERSGDRWVKGPGIVG